MDAMRTRLAEVLAAYGADPARWPAVDRDRLWVLAGREPESLAEAREIDQVLALARAPEVPAGAAGRLLARVREEERQPNVMPFNRGPVRPKPAIWSWGAAAALAASFGMGIFLGASNLNLPFGDNGVVEIDDPLVLTGIDDATDLLEGDS